MLAACRSPNIVRYYASVLPRGSARLAIAMELMAASAADLVSVRTIGLQQIVQEFRLNCSAGHRHGAHGGVHRGLS